MVRIYALSVDAVRGFRSWGDRIPVKAMALTGALGITVDSSSSLSSISGRKRRMASLVLKMSVSLDGCVAPIDGSTDPIAAGGSDDALSWTVETVSNAGAHLMGATAYA
jgi:hypothetical protein